MEKLSINYITFTSLVAAMLSLGEIASNWLPKMPNGGSIDIKVLLLILAGAYLLKIYNQMQVFRLLIVATIISVLIGWMVIYQHVVFPLGLIFDYLIPQLLYCVIILFISKNNFVLIGVSLAILLASFSSYVLSGILVWETNLWGSIIYNITWFWPMIFLVPITAVLAKNKLWMV